jgi:predicted Ser/Thr protein kinase
MVAVKCTRKDNEAINQLAENGYSDKAAKSIWRWYNPAKKKKDTPKYEQTQLPTH